MPRGAASVPGGRHTMGRNMDIIAETATKLTEDFILSLATYRYKVFVEQLGWQLDTPPGIELDQFDRPDTLYVVARNHAEDIIGCARLLPTTHPYLLEEIFPELLNGLLPPKSAEVWELSRFAAVDFSNNTSGLASGQISSSVTLSIFAAVMQVARQQGAKRLLMVSYLGAERLVRHAGYHVHRAGPPKQVDGQWIMACWVEIPA